jgi:hypothetical protein
VRVRRGRAFLINHSLGSTTRRFASSSARFWQLTAYAGKGPILVATLQKIRVHFDIDAADIHAGSDHVGRFLSVRLRARQRSQRTIYFELI